MDAAARLEPIPHPPGHVFVGNLFDLDASHPVESLMDLARKYGPIYELEVLGSGSRVIVSSHELVDELCDESRFDKMLGPGLKAIAEGPADRGLFTSETSDPNLCVPAVLDAGVRAVRAADGADAAAARLPAQDRQGRRLGDRGAERDELDRRAQARRRPAARAPTPTSSWRSSSSSRTRRSRSAPTRSSTRPSTASRPTSSTTTPTSWPAS